MVTLGTKIIGDFGGYTELWNGEVVTIETFAWVRAREAEVKVKWDNGTHTWVVKGEINTNKYAGIGYYTEEAFYA